MSNQLSIKTTVCSEYQQLLEECRSALEIWNKQRDEIYQSHLSGRNVDNELRRLQAKYARAYTVLQNHAHNCLRCQLVSRIEGRDTENNSYALSGSNKGFSATC
jgi:hypothetical protein